MNDTERTDFILFLINVLTQTLHFHFKQNKISAELESSIFIDTILHLATSALVALELPENDLRECLNEFCLNVKKASKDKIFN